MSWSVSQSVAGVVLLLAFAGVFFVWLHFEIKARRDMAAERIAQIATPKPEQPGK
jgi:hypothetical protein